MTIFDEIPRFINFGDVFIGEEVVRKLKLRHSRPFGFEFRVERETPCESLKFSVEKGMIRGEEEIALFYKPNSFRTLSERVTVRVANSPPHAIFVTGSCKPGFQGFPDSKNCVEEQLHALSPAESDNEIMRVEERLGNTVTAYEPINEEKAGVNLHHKMMKIERICVFRGAVSVVIKRNRLLRVLKGIKGGDSTKTEPTNIIY